MNKEEFLAQLKLALGGNISGALVQENLDYYNNYIMEEVRKGKSEREVMEMLGDPWILARTIIDANDGTDQETVYEAGGDTGSYKQGSSYAYEEQGERPRGGFADLLRMDTWWKKLLVVLAVVMVLMLVVSIITGLVRLLLPLFIPLLVIALLVRLIGGRNS